MSNKKLPSLSVTDGLDFVKRVWGSLPIPSVPNVMTPTTDVEELDKRIADLKAVEQWLNVNLSMLRATIQGLEVQRGTIATIRSFGASFGLKPSVPRAEAKPAAVELPPVTFPEINAHVPSDAFASALAAIQQSGGVSGWSNPAQAAEEAEKQAEDEKKSKPLGGEAAGALISNASAWWGVLQDQLNKVAATALAGGGLNPSAAEEAAKEAKAKKSATTARKPAAKPAVKASAGAARKKPAAKPASGATRKKASDT